MAKIEVKVIPLKDMTLLPPADPLACQECAVRHDPSFPHNQQSLYYQYHFFQEHDRWPTWKDAMAHCSDEMKQYWIEALKIQGVEVPT
ncbi:MAG: hypothetical protein AB9917_13785 [Negativicutes bacterium]